ncbi:MAG: hypothetical protein IJ192_09780 [Clostridia bacterium]|nr:hypothetical protein [Clostridia bacterium]
MAVLSILEVPELKKMAEQYGYTIHIHDACGGQAFSLEENGEVSDEIYHALEEFFKKHHMTIHFFDEKKHNFSAR